MRYPKGTSPLFSKLPCLRGQPVTKWLHDRYNVVYLTEPTESGTNSNMAELRNAFCDPKVISSFEFESRDKGDNDFESFHSKKFAALAFGIGYCVKLENALIDELTFSGESINLDKCVIGKLTLSNPIGIASIKNCEIGILAIDSEFAKRVISDNCNILSFTSFERKAKSYELAFTNCIFATKTARRSEAAKIDATGENERGYQAPALTIQSFRDLHAWASDFSMSDLAHTSRGIELRLERTLESTGLAKAALSVWSVTCDYGLKPGRAVTILALLTVTLGMLLYCVGTEPAANASSWIKGLCAVERAAVAALTNVINPYAALSPRSVIYPINGLGAAAMTIHGLCSITLVLFVGFSLRRRFKFQ